MSLPLSDPTTKTVFIVGAGASKEANLPIGSELKKSIASALDLPSQPVGRQAGDVRILEALQAKVPPSGDITPFLKAAWHIRDAMPQASSIDNFIDSQDGDKAIELCGKLAIVRTILQAEAKSSMFVEQHQPASQINFERLESTWFHGFTQLLFDSCKAKGLPERLRKVVLIIFNYDRCIEHYMYYAIQNYYQMSGEEAAKLLENLEVYHPYGTVGSLPWLKRNNEIAFGDTPEPLKLLSLAGQIKTFTEGTDEESSDVKVIRGYIDKAKKLVFLGFAFHRMNLDLLLPQNRPNVSKPGQRIFATAYGISKSGTSDIERALRSGWAIVTPGDWIQIRNDLTCSQLIQEYLRSLAFV